MLYPAIEEMQEIVSPLARTLKGNELVADEGLALLEVLEQYSRSWRLLLEYDERRLAEAPSQPVPPSGGLSVQGGSSSSST